MKIILSPLLASMLVLSFQGNIFAQSSTSAQSVTFEIKETFERQTNKSWLSATEEERQEFLEQYKKQKRMQRRVKYIKERNKDREERQFRRQKRIEQKNLERKRKLQAKKERAEHKAKEQKRREMRKKFRNMKKEFRAKRNKDKRKH